MYVVILTASSVNFHKRNTKKNMKALKPLGFEQKPWA